MRLDNEALCKSNVKWTPSYERVNVISRADTLRHLSGFPSFMVADEAVALLILKLLFSCQCTWNPLFLKEENWNTPHAIK